MALFALFLVFKHNALSIIPKNQVNALSFVLFTVIFLTTAFSHGDKFTLVFSQYSLYFLLFCFFLILKKNSQSSVFIEKLNHLFFFLVFVQVILSLAKYVITGPMESIVGSMCYSGGAYATVFPVIGFAFLWLYRKGNFNREDWLFVAGLFFIGFVSYKRAIWFILPVIIFLFSFYVPKRKIPSRIKLAAIVIIPIVLYLGIRLNPTLNRENQIWGSFDLNYTKEYVRKYTFGDRRYSNGEKIAEGRGGATTLLFEKLIKGELEKSDWTGNGLTLMYVEAPQNDKDLIKRFNINSIGSASGFMQTYVVSGFIGVFATLFFAISILSHANNNRIRYVIIGFFLWEYFFYTGAILREPAFSILLVFNVIYSNNRLPKAFGEKQNN